MFPIKVETRILLNCPHCRFSSRYDTNFLEDAIHDKKEISCVACGGHFQIFVVGMIRATEDRVEAEGEQGRAIPDDKIPYEVYKDFEQGTPFKDDTK